MDLDLDSLPLLSLPPWAQTALTVLGLASLVLPAVGRSRTVATRWPRLASALVDLGTDIRSALASLRR